MSLGVEVTIQVTVGGVEALDRELECLLPEVSDPRAYVVLRRLRALMGRAVVEHEIEERQSRRDRARALRSLPPAEPTRDLYEW